MMAALIESLGIGQQRDEVVSFTWTDLLQLEAACCSAIISHQSHLQLSLTVEHSSAESPHVIVLLLPRSALLLAMVLACTRLQVRPFCETDSLLPLSNVCHAVAVGHSQPSCFCR
jgi:hypothetical protein